jgi:hypothetical protein
MPSVFTLEGPTLCRPGLGEGMVIGGPTAFAVAFMLAGLATGVTAYAARRAIAPKRRRTGPRGSRWSY